MEGNRDPLCLGSVCVYMRERQREFETETLKPKLELTVTEDDLELLTPWPPLSA